MLNQQLNKNLSLAHVEHLGHGWDAQTVVAALLQKLNIAPSVFQQGKAHWDDLRKKLHRHYYYY